MIVGDADTLCLNVARANLYMLVVNRSVPMVVKLIMRDFQYSWCHDTLVFDLTLTSIAKLYFWHIDFNLFLQLENMISLTPAFVNQGVNKTSGSGLQRGAATKPVTLILRNKATALYSSGNKGSSNGCNIVSPQKLSFISSIFLHTSDFAATTWEFLFQASPLRLVAESFFGAQKNERTLKMWKEQMRR